MCNASSKKGKVVDKDEDIRLDEENLQMHGKPTIQISGDARNRHPQHRQTHTYNYSSKI